MLYFRRAKKKITLEMLAGLLAKMDARIERGFESPDDEFEALADDIKHDKATKEQMVVLHGQVNAIETQLRGLQHVRLHTRVADLEDKVFGKVRD